YNKNPPGIYKLPLKAILIPCTLSQFYSVFKSYIHHRFSKSGRVRCLFRDDHAYSLLSQILNNEQWGVKYFANKQQTYVTFQPSRERAPGSIQKEIKPKIKQLQGVIISKLSLLK
ncbi:16426_t:CDS:2, partial [Gigaspora margarita]